MGVPYFLKHRLHIGGFATEHLFLLNAKSPMNSSIQAIQNPHTQKTHNINPLFHWIELHYKSDFIKAAQDMEELADHIINVASEENLKTTKDIHYLLVHLKTTFRKMASIPS